MKFTVVIPTRDRPGLVESAVESVLNQHEQDFEVIVVNDGIRSAIATNDPRVTVIHSGGKGVAAARNVGVRASSGAFLTFLDDDDLYLPNRLDVPDVPVSVCWRRESRGMTLYGWWPQPSPHVGQVTVRRDICPLFDEGFTRTEDVDWWLTILEMHRQPLELPMVGYLLRDIAADRLTSSTQDEVARCVLRLLSKHPVWFTAHPDAAAFNWRRAGLAAHESAYLWRSFRLRRRPKTLATILAAKSRRLRA